MASRSAGTACLTTGSGAMLTTQEPINPLDQPFYKAILYSRIGFIVEGRIHGRHGFEAVALSQLDGGDAFQNVGAQFLLADLLKQVGRLFVELERLGQFLQSFESSCFIGQRHSLFFDIAGLSKYFISPFDGLQGAVWVATFEERHAAIIGHFGCIWPVAGGLI